MEKVPNFLCFPFLTHLKRVATNYLIIKWEHGVCEGEAGVQAHIWLQELRVCLPFALI